MGFELGKSYDELMIGEGASFSKTIKEMALEWTNQRGEVVVVGEALVIPPPPLVP
jgi:hypothetical protein